MRHAVIAASLAMVLAACAPADPGEARLAATGAGWRILNVADANGDGLSDIVWANNARNEIEVWLLNGTRVLARGPRLPGPPARYRAASAADVNRDGMIDVIWTDDAASTMFVWLMNGTRVLAAGPELQGPTGGDWILVNAGDKNGDGLADVIWYSRTRHAIRAMLLDGARTLAIGPELPAPPGPVTGREWTVSNETDTNADGLNDVIWNIDDPPRIAVWLMNGARPLARGPEIPGPEGDGWRVVTTDDFNRDGMSDVVWGKPGWMTIWLMNGAQVLARGPEIPGPGPDDVVGNAGDCNGDGLADVVWRGPGGGRITVFLMNGAQVLAPGPSLAGPAFD